MYLHALGSKWKLAESVCVQGLQRWLREIWKLLCALWEWIVPRFRQKRRRGGNYIQHVLPLFVMYHAESGWKRPRIVFDPAVHEDIRHRVQSVQELLWRRQLHHRVLHDDGRHDMRSLRNQVQRGLLPVWKDVLRERLQRGQCLGLVHRVLHSGFLHKGRILPIGALRRHHASQQHLRPLRQVKTVQLRFLQRGLCRTSRHHLRPVHILQHWFLSYRRVSGSRWDLQTMLHMCRNQRGPTLHQDG